MQNHITSDMALALVHAKLALAAADQSVAYGQRPAAALGIRRAEQYLAEFWKAGQASGQSQYALTVLFEPLITPMNQHLAALKCTTVGEEKLDAEIANLADKASEESAGLLTWQPIEHEELPEFLQRVLPTDVDHVVRIGRIEQGDPEYASLKDRMRLWSVNND